MSTQTPLNNQQIIDLLLDLDEEIADLHYRFTVHNYKESDLHRRAVEIFLQLRKADKERKQ